MRLQLQYKEGKVGKSQGNSENKTIKIFCPKHQYPSYCNTVMFKTSWYLNNFKLLPESELLYALAVARMSTALCLCIQRLWWLNFAAYCVSLAHDIGAEFSPIRISWTWNTDNRGVTGHMYSSRTFQYMMSGSGCNFLDLIRPVTQTVTVKIVYLCTRKCSN